MAQNDTLLAEYFSQPVVRRRNSAALVQWAFGTRNIPMPPNKPDAEFVRLRITAERIPQNLNGYVDRTLPYFLQSNTTQTNIRMFLNAFNDDATETALSGQNSDIIANFMPAFAAADINSAQVEQWYTENGFSTTPPTEPEAVETAARRR